MTNLTKKTSKTQPQTLDQSWPCYSRTNLFVLAVRVGGAPEVDPDASGLDQPLDVLDLLDDVAASLQKERRHDAVETTPLQRDQLR